MVLKYIPSFSGIGEASVIAAAADDAIQHAAHAILAEAQRLAAEDDELAAFSASLRVDTGARPKGRGYARVVADTPDATALEWGDNSTARLRILGRAAGIQIFPDISK